MDEDEDDLYQQHGTATQNGHYNAEPDYGDDDEGEDIEEDSDSDIDIITERKPDTSKPDPPSQQQQQQKPAKPDTATHQSATAADKPSEKSSTPQPQTHQRYSAPQSSKPGSDYPAVRTSTLDIEAPIPTYEPVGKPLTDLDFDADLAENTKPWRLPGTDPTDYFNYGFDEFTWATYCLKQKTMRETIADQKAESAQFEMMWGGSLPGMPSQLPAGAQPAQQAGQTQQAQQPQQQQAPAAPQGPANAGMPNMPPMPGMGMPEMTPDMMNQLMQQMMASGVDPMQMDFGTFMQQMSSIQGGAPPMGGMPGNQPPQQQTQSFAGGQSQGYGSGGGGGGGGGGGNASGQGSAQQSGGQRRNQGRRW